MAFAEVKRRQRRALAAAVGGLVGRRLLIFVPILVAVSLGVFALSAFSPFDPLHAYLGDALQTTSMDRRQEISDALGLERPWWQAWQAWVTDLAHGDLGRSRVFAQDVSTVFAQRLPWTLLLSGCGLLLAIILGVGLGCWAGLRSGGLIDRFASGLAMVVQALPPYVFGLLAITVFALGLRMLPAGGISPPGAPITAGSVARHLILPVVVLGISQLSWFLLSTRDQVRAALGSEAVRGAVARGLSPATVIRGHVLPVSLAPVVTLIGVRLPEIIVGSVLVEEIFGWPGLSAAVVTAARQLDFPLLAALTIATTAVVLLGSLLADALYLFLDPRVKHD